MVLSRLLMMRFFQSANVLGVILTLYYRSHGLDYVQILSFEIVLSLAMVVMTVPLGLFADRYGRVRALKFGNLAFILGALVFLAARVYWQFLLSDVLYGLGLAWQSGADTALLAPGGTRWFARYEAAAAVSGLLSSVLAGWLLAADGMHILVILNAVAALGAGLAIVTLPNDVTKPQTATRPWTHMGEAARAVRGTPWILLWTVGTAIGFRLVGINLMFLDLPLWVARGWHGLWLGIGVAVLYAAGWASLLIPAAEARLGTRATLLVSQLAMGMLVLSLPLFGSPWLLTLAMALALALQAMQTPVTNAAISAALAEPVRVTALSILDLPSLAVTIAGELGVGLLADVHLSWALWASGAAVLAAVPLFWSRSRTKLPQEGLLSPSGLH